MIFRGTWIVKDHPEFEWKLFGVQTLLRKIDETSDIEPQEGYGWPKTVRTEENNEAVQEIIPRQEGQHKKPVLFVPDCPSWLGIISCAASMFSSVQTVFGRPYPSCGLMSLVSSIFRRKDWTPPSFHSNSGWSSTIHMPLWPCFCRSYLITIFFSYLSPILHEFRVQNEP